MVSKRLELHLYVCLIVIKFSRLASSHNFLFLLLLLLLLLLLFGLLSQS